MYIVIVCVNCNGSSQVEEAVLGKVVQCPLCDKPTVARTPTAVLPVAKPIEPVTVESTPANPVETPLSLDDATPLAPPVSPKSIPEPKRKPSREPPPKRSPVRTAVYASISLLMTLVVMAAIYMGFRYGNGQIPDGDWKTFKPLEGNCSVLMPGEPISEDIAAQGFGELGGKRFTVKRWFERVEVSFGWMDYDAKVVNQRFGELVLPLRDREIKRLNGSLVGESEVNYSVNDGPQKKREIKARLATIDLEKGKAFLQVYFDADPERLRYVKQTEMVPMQFLLFAPVANIWFPIDVAVPTPVRVIEPGQRIRIWFASAQGKKIVSETAWISKFFTSFAPE